MTVWIVFYHREVLCEPTTAHDIEAVFSTKEKAIAFVAERQASPLSIEPHEVDEYQ